MITIIAIIALLVWSVVLTVMLSNLDDRTDKNIIDIRQSLRSHKDNICKQVFSIVDNKVDRLHDRVTDLGAITKEKDTDLLTALRELADIHGYSVVVKRVPVNTFSVLDQEALIQNGTINAPTRFGLAVEKKAPVKKLAVKRRR